MKIFVFTVYLQGEGENAEEAWADAAENCHLEECDADDFSYTEEDYEDM